MVVGAIGLLAKDQSLDETEVLMTVDDWEDVCFCLKVASPCSWSSSQNAVLSAPLDSSCNCGTALLLAMVLDYRYHRTLWALHRLELFVCSSDVVLSASLMVAKTVMKFLTKFALPLIGHQIVVRLWVNAGVKQKARFVSVASILPISN